MEDHNLTKGRGSMGFGEHSSFMYLGASTEVGYIFWQHEFGKNENMYLDQAFNKPSIEVLTAQSRVYKTLDRGSVKHSIDIFVNPQSMVQNLDRGLNKARSRVKVDLDRASLISYK